MLLNLHGIGWVESPRNIQLQAWPSHTRARARGRKKSVSVQGMNRLSSSPFCLHILMLVEFLGFRTDKFSRNLPWMLRKNSERSILQSRFGKLIAASAHERQNSLARLVHFLSRKCPLLHRKRISDKKI
jgi:hypothetical protein